MTLSNRLMSTRKATHAHLMMTVTVADFQVISAHSVLGPLNTKIEPAMKYYSHD